MGSTPVGSPVAGTGTTLTFGPQTVVGTYTVTATNTLTTCVGGMTGSVSISTISLPTLYTVTGGGSFCSGGTGVHVGLSGSTPGLYYDLYVGGSLTTISLLGTGAALDFGALTTGGTYTVLCRNTTTGCSVAMTGSASVVVNPLPTVYTVTGGGGYCSGGTGSAIGLSNSTSGINYQLYNGGVAVGSTVGGTGGAISFGPQTAVGTYTVNATNATTGCTSNMAGSVAVSINALPTVYSVTGGGGYCAGSTGVNVYLSGSQYTTNYQLYNGSTAVGSPVAGNSIALLFGTMTSAGTYTAVATNTSTGCTSNMSGSATVVVNPLPTVYAVTGGGGYCSGGTGVTIGVANSATGINYQLYKAGPTSVGSPVAGTGSAMSFPLQTAADVYTVTAGNASTGCRSAMSGSATVTIHALPAPVGFNSTGSLCSGGAGSDLYLSGSAVGISYQLYNNGLAVGSPSSGIGALLDFGIQSATGTYSVVATNSGTSCSDNMSGLVTIGTSATISAAKYTVAPSTVIALTGTPSGGSWTSGTTSVATVNSSGVVTGVALGTSVITYTNGSCTATVTVSVTATGYRTSHPTEPDVTQPTTESSNIVIAPNPNRGVFNIKGSLGTGKDVEVIIELTDMMGRVVYRDNLLATDGIIDQQVHINSTIANGMYLLTLHSTAENKVFHIVVAQ